VANNRGLAPFIVFSDATLRDLARRRPSTLDGFQSAHGVGEKKVADYGIEFLRQIADYCQRNNVTMNVAAAVAERSSKVSRTMLQAFEYFSQGMSLEQAGQALARAPSTTHGYLVEYIQREGICDPSNWLDAEMFRRVQKAGDEVGIERLKPIFELLNGEVSYDQIRIAVTCLRNMAPVS
jgi:ATP-dependent DNA helicase RecQ